MQIDLTIGSCKQYDSGLGGEAGIASRGMYVRAESTSVYSPPLSSCDPAEGRRDVPLSRIPLPSGIHRAELIL